MDGLWLPVAVLFVVSLGYGVIVPLLPQLQGGGSETALAIIFVAYSAAKIGGQVPSGVAVDRYGPVAIVRAGMVLFTASLAMFLLPGTALFATARLAEGLATGLVYTGMFTLVARGDPATAGRRIGIVGGLGTAGILVGPVLGALLSPYGIRIPILVAVAVSAGVTAIAWPIRDRGGAVYAVRWSAVRRYGADSTFLAGSLPVVFNKVTFTAFQAMIPLLVPERFHRGQGAVAVMYVISAVGFAVSQPIGGWLADRYRPSVILSWLVAPLLAGLVTLDFGGWGAFLVVYTGYVLTSSLVFTVSMKDVVARYPDPETQGTVIGVFTSLTDIGTLIGPSLALALHAWAPGQVFSGIAVFGVPAYLVWWIWGRRDS